MLSGLHDSSSSKASSIGLIPTVWCWLISQLFGQSAEVKSQQFWQWIIIYQSKLENIFEVQLLKCEDLLIPPGLYHCKLTLIGFCTPLIWQNKQRKEVTLDSGNLTCDFAKFSSLFNQLNHELEVIKLTWSSKELFLHSSNSLFSTVLLYWQSDPLWMGRIS